MKTKAMIKWEKLSTSQYEAWLAFDRMLNAGSRTMGRVGFGRFDFGDSVDVVVENVSKLDVPNVYVRAYLLALSILFMSKKRMMGEFDGEDMGALPICIHNEFECSLACGGSHPLGGCMIPDNGDSSLRILCNLYKKAYARVPDEYKAK